MTTPIKGRRPGKKDRRDNERRNLRRRRNDKRIAALRPQTSWERAKTDPAFNIRTAKTTELLGSLARYGLVGTAIEILDEIDRRIPPPWFSGGAWLYADSEVQRNAWDP